MVTATGKKQDFKQKITWKTIRKMEYTIHPEEKRKKYIRLAGIAMLIFSEVMYLKLDIKVIPQIINLFLTFLSTAAIVEWILIRQLAKSLSKDLEADFFHRITVKDGCLMIEGEGMERKIMFSQNIIVFEYGSIIMIQKLEGRGHLRNLYIAEIKDLERFYELIKGELCYYKI